jgi:DNA (cytosine-5)-methyltransferase 1
MRFIDLFAGIGGIRLGFEAVFKDAQCLFSSEWDKYAQITYEANFGEKPSDDITLIKEEEIPPFDILLAGFPCQAFSVAGLRKGFEDTRGTLFFDIVRIIKYHKPQVVFLENVKNLKTHNHGNTIKTIYHELQKLGYFIKDKILNTMDYGNIPQNRERIYIVCFLSEEAYFNFKFPSKILLETKIIDCLNNNIEEKYYYNNKPLFERVVSDIVKKNTLYQWRRKYVRENKNNVCPTLTANMGMGGHNVPILLDDKGIRKLTPRECANFQGFPSNYILPTNLPDSAIYKQIGNSVSIPVIKQVANCIKNAFIDKK